MGETFISLYIQGPRGLGVGGFTSHRQGGQGLKNTLNTTQKPFVFKFVFKARENQKQTVSEAPPTQHNSTPKFTNTILVKVDFHNTFDAKTSSFESHELKLRYNSISILENSIQILSQKRAQCGHISILSIEPL